MKKVYLPLLASVFFAASALAQSDLRVYKAQPAGVKSHRSLFESLVGEGVVLRSYSITKTSSDEAFGFFEDKQASLGMKKGLIMTTGGISALCGRNTVPNMSNNVHHVRQDNLRYDANDNKGRCAELEKFLSKGQKTFDACVLEMDIIPTADTLSFNYVFGSEEYDEFVGSQFNDAFAFFITGKGIEGERNLAVVPGTEIPVSVNTINHGGNSSYHTAPSNPTFYVSNVAGNIAIEYDGMTRLMEIRQPVIPYETYHIKLAVADVSDNSYDSGVFIEGQSIISYEKSYNVLFAKNSDEIETGYQTFLANLAAVYKNRDGKISVTGHTDNEGDENLNSALSCKRANAVAAFLNKKGIAMDRIIVDCKGESMPEFDNNSDKGKALNRRAQVKLLGNNTAYEEKRKKDVVAEEPSKLLSNYPNPFGNVTTIDAFIKADVKNAYVLITDMNGNSIKTIYMLERGKTSATFDGSYLASGTYLAHLMVDGQSGGALKMVVQK